jgi:hypothetical protein
MFRHRRQLRLWAAQVLFLWLFGITAAVANACMGPGEPSALAGAHAGACHGQPQASMDHHPAAPEKSNCQDFCDKASVSIPPLKWMLDDMQLHALSLSVVAVVVPVPAFEWPAWRVPRRDVLRAPPIPIAFLRLTL